jgi:hypothetical protein
MRKKSKYKPKNVRTDNLNWILAGMKKVGSLPEAGVSLKLKNHEALDELLMGKANRDHIDVLIAAFNIAEALYIINPELGADWKDEIKKAQDAIHTLGKRCIDRPTFACTGEEREALRIGMEVHDAQLDACNVREMEQALYMVAEVVRLKKARPILEAA